MKKSLRCKAFTLLEIIFGMAIIAVLFALTLPLFRKNNSAPRLAAEQLASALQLARQYAREHAAATRVVFPDAELCAYTTNKLSNAYGLYTFYVPHSDTTNISISADHVGQWIPLPVESEWQHLSENVQETFSKGANDENTLRTFFFNPPQTWALGATNCFDTNYAGSFYPRNYWQTPCPTSYPLAEQTNSDGSIEKYFQLLGTPRFFNLRGVEFDSQGKATFSNTNVLKIRLYDIQNTNNYYEVWIDRASGIAQLKP